MALVSTKRIIRLYLTGFIEWKAKMNRPILDLVSVFLLSAKLLAGIREAFMLKVKRIKVLCLRLYCLWKRRKWIILFNRSVIHRKLRNVMDQQKHRVLVLDDDPD